MTHEVHRWPSNASYGEPDAPRELRVWLFAWSEPKLRADLDAPPPMPEWLVGVCGECDGTGVRSEHALPGTYGVEPCRACGVRSASGLKEKTT